MAHAMAVLGGEALRIADVGQRRIGRAGPAVRPGPHDETADRYPLAAEVAKRRPLRRACALLVVLLAALRRPVFPDLQPGLGVINGVDRHAHAEPTRGFTRSLVGNSGSVRDMQERLEHDLAIALRRLLRRRLLFAFGAGGKESG